MKDDLGKRMKEQYEERTRTFVPRRTYTIIRLDGCHFHTYTRGRKKPFDHFIMAAMRQATLGLCKSIQGVRFGYVQSDEISLLLTDFDTTATQAWYDGNIQKMASVSASIATMWFNSAVMTFSCDLQPTATFDSRVFTIPDPTEVENYFIWRNQDCARNSVSAVAQANFSHKELQNKSTAAMHEMLHQKGVNWATDFTEEEKNGSIVIRKKMIVRDRGEWSIEPAWKFSAERDRLKELIPRYE